LLLKGDNIPIMTMMVMMMMIIIIKEAKTWRKNLED
jgi:hypothetical protein